MRYTQLAAFSISSSALFYRIEAVIHTFICSMLHFNRFGLLVPHSAIPSSIDEFKSEFLDNIPTPERLLHFNAYLEYSRQLKILCGDVKLRQWINGSFVTKKPVPADIDFVTFIDYQIISAAGTAIKKFIYPHSIEVFKVDAYIVEIHPPGSNKYALYQSDSAYWKSQFDRTRRNRVGKKLGKGFLEIVY